MSVSSARRPRRPGQISGIAPVSNNSDQKAHSRVLVNNIPHPISQRAHPPFSSPGVRNFLAASPRHVAGRPIASLSWEPPLDPSLLLCVCRSASEMRYSRATKRASTRCLYRIGDRHRDLAIRLCSVSPIVFVFRRASRRIGRQRGYLFSYGNWYQRRNMVFCIQFFYQPFTAYSLSTMPLR